MLRVRAAVRPQEKETTGIFGEHEPTHQLPDRDGDRLGVGVPVSLPVPQAKPSAALVLELVQRLAAAHHGLNLPSAAVDGAALFPRALALGAIQGDDGAFGVAIGKEAGGRLVRHLGHRPRAGQSLAGSPAGCAGDRRLPGRRSAGPEHGRAQSEKETLQVLAEPWRRSGVESRRGCAPRTGGGHACPPLTPFSAPRGGSPVPIRCPPVQKGPDRPARRHPHPATAAGPTQ